MERIFLMSTNNYLTKCNIFEQNIKLAEIYCRRKELTMYQLQEFSRDLKIFKLFLLYNVKKENINVFSRFFKENRKMRTQITKLINNKINSISL